MLEPMIGSVECWHCVRWCGAARPTYESGVDPKATATGIVTCGSAIRPSVELFESPPNPEMQRRSGGALTFPRMNCDWTRNCIFAFHGIIFYATKREFVVGRLECIAFALKYSHTSCQPPTQSAYLTALTVGFGGGIGGVAFRVRPAGQRWIENSTASMVNEMRKLWLIKSEGEKRYRKNMRLLGQLQQISGRSGRRIIGKITSNCIDSIDSMEMKEIQNYHYSSGNGGHKLRIDTLGNLHSNYFTSHPQFT